MVSLCRPVAAAPQQPAAADLPVSLEHIREGLEKPPEGLLTFPPPVPLPVFRATVEEKRFMLSFEEQLHKDLEPTLLQVQSREWASKCCGLDLGALFKSIDRALDRRRQRKIRQEIARELEELKVATAKAAAAAK
jgi:hypothetical protein